MELNNKAMDAQKIIPVILSGGFGRRLWPLSRELYPKQLHPLVSNKSLLQETALRTSDVFFDSPLVICNENHRFIVSEQFRQININPKAVILEPVGRNTAPAAAVAAVLSEKIANDVLLLVIPSDHTIKDVDKFMEAVRTAQEPAKQGRLVTLGIPPTRAESGYGYIQAGEALPNAPGSYDISKFIEKPEKATAIEYFNAGKFLWNSGIYLFSAKSYLQELRTFQPEVARLSRIAMENIGLDGDFVHLNSDAFEKNTAISIDYAVMEHTDKGAVVPAHMGWYDVGSWEALWEISAHDEFQNVLLGDVITEEVENSYIRSEAKWIAVAGLKDAIVVATDDTVLVAAKSHSQNVGNLVTKLKERAPDLTISHSKVYRPWGWYQSLEQGERFQVKLINLTPGAKISLQRHQHRAEHWVVVSGKATITCGEKVFELKENQSTFISAGEKHRLENMTDIPLQIIEVQSGTYLGEDDIERFDDQYGRN